MAAPLAAVTASFCCGDDRWHLGLDASTDIVTLGALVTFLPGMALTIGVRELATQHLQSGVANTANALVQLLGLVVGVAVGRWIATSWFGIPQQGVTGHQLLGDLRARSPGSRTRVHGHAASPIQSGADHVLRDRPGTRRKRSRRRSRRRPGRRLRRNARGRPRRRSDRIRASPLTAGLHRARRAHARTRERGLRQHLCSCSTTRPSAASRLPSTRSSRRRPSRTA